jgi:nitrate/TMAO reductase-like tetraheme cytochrome c subunit
VDALEGNRPVNDKLQHPLLAKPLWTNWMTLAGTLVASIALLLLLTFGLFSLVSPAANPYVDIVGYLILPGFLALGCVMMVVGILIRSIRRRRLDPARKLRILPRPDFSDPMQLRVAKYLAVGMLALLPITAVTGYHGYHFTDSTEFCGSTCHTVMQPESVTYERSSHARVSCAECHIGSGASWFVKSKVSGLRQVVATVRESYPRPIPPAITELRPARETCEECHWPQKFYGSQLREFPHYASDEQNTDRTAVLLLKTGGGDEASGRASGIHRHMALSGRIEYIATDEYLQEIPWVSWTDPSGTKHIYRSDGRPASDPLPEGERRTIDCMDCHNRPAHEFLSPQESVDLALSIGQIDGTLPYIKREAVAAVSPPYLRDDEASARIGAQLSEFYRDNYPDLWEKRRASIYQAIDATRKIYFENVFSTMNVDWTAYPDNIGHMYSAGCFRCHDNRHVSQTGEPISSDCESCHTFLIGNGSGEDVSYTTGAFEHPMSLAGPHEAVTCHRCHSGGPTLPNDTCENCHQAENGLIAAELVELESFGIEPDLMAGMVTCEDCHSTSDPHSREVALQSCSFCHDADGSYEAGHVANVRELAELRGQVLDRIDENPKGHWAVRAREIVALLDDAGSHHNAEGSRKVLQDLLAIP